MRLRDGEEEKEKKNIFLTLFFVSFYTFLEIGNRKSKLSLFL